MHDRPPLFARLLILIVALFITCFFGWAAVASVDEIARGAGKVIPVSKTQIIQTSEDGVVDEIAVKIGEVVKKGQLLVRLSNTMTASSLGESEAKARALQAKIARLDMEVSGEIESDYRCPADIEKEAPEICANERELMSARRANYETKLSVLKQRRVQRETELNEATANVERLQGNIAISEKERAMIAPMVKRQLVAETQLLTIDKDLTEQRGQLDLAQRSIPRLQAAIDEAKLQVEELGSEFQQEALAEKTQALADLSVVEETIRGATDRVARTDIRSPVDGIVNTLEVNTIGAYVQPGAVVAGIVPTSDVLLVEARISPRDVAFVQKGQPAIVKVTAYDFSIFGGLKGEVVNVSADSLVDQKTGNTYYEVQVKTDRSALEKGGKQYAIIPGMVTAVEIMTGRKTVLAYLMKPINKARTEALTER